jgi:hypothetical protein
MCHDCIWGSGGIASLIHNIGTGWGKWLASCPDRCTTSQLKGSLVPIEYEAVWVPEPVLMLGEMKSLLPLLGIEPGFLVFEPIAWTPY